MKFDKDYFENGIKTGVSCYENYRWIPELTIPLAHEIVTQLKIKKTDKILDYGCAKGYLVKALRLLGYNAYGVDVSQYAISDAPSDIKKYIHRIKEPYEIKEGYDWIIAKDVFEHISYGDIKSTIASLSFRTKNLFVIVPLGEEGYYNAPSNNLDRTHIICEDLKWWVAAMNETSMKKVIATTEMKNIKKSYDNIKDAHAFIIYKQK